jgi:dihydroorotase
MKLIIRDGTVVVPTGRFKADLICENGRILSINESGTSTQFDVEVDARELLVFPGFIDPHVHSRDPGLTYKEDFEHLSRAAAAGGVTTVLEMPNAIPPLSTVDVLEERARDFGTRSAVDFGLWAISFGKDNLVEIPRLLERGAIAVKLFWGYHIKKDTRELVYNPSPEADVLPPPTNTDVFQLFDSVARAGGLLAAHCEDSAVITARLEKLGRPIKDYADMLEVRPDTAESASIALGIEYARASGCNFHVVHTSAALSVQLIRRAQRDNVRVTAETCPHYLAFAASDCERLGPAMKVFPPIKKDNDRAALRAALRDGTICSVGSDHAPHTDEEKRRGLAEAPAGSPGVETLARVMLDLAHAGHLTYEQLAWVLSEGTARLYRLHPTKGAIKPGADADLTLVDPEARWTIQGAELHSKSHVTPWEGLSGYGSPVMAFVRGQEVMRGGKPVGEAVGRFVKPRSANRSPARLSPPEKNTAVGRRGYQSKKD